jgi:hypothetical protein
MVEVWLSIPVGEDLLFDRSLLLGGALGELSSLDLVLESDRDLRRCPPPEFSAEALSKP